MSRIEEDELVVRTKLLDLIRKIILQPAACHILIRPERDVLDRNLHLLDENILHRHRVSDREGYPTNILLLIFFDRDKDGVR